MWEGSGGGVGLCGVDRGQGSRQASAEKKLHWSWAMFKQLMNGMIIMAL